MSLKEIYDYEAKKEYNTQIVKALREIDEDKNGKIDENEFAKLKDYAFRFALNILEVGAMGQQLIGFDTSQCDVPPVLKVIAGSDRIIDAYELDVYLKNHDAVPLSSKYPKCAGALAGILSGTFSGALVAMGSRLILKADPRVLLGATLIGMVTGAIQGVYRGASAGSNYGLSSMIESYFKTPKTQPELTILSPQTQW